MKILDFKSNHIQEKQDFNTNVSKVKSIKKSVQSTVVSHNIKPKKFDTTIAKLRVEDDLDVATIERLRNEINSNSITSEKLANAMINFVENNSWHKRL